MLWQSLWQVSCKERLVLGLHSPTGRENIIMPMKGVSPQHRRQRVLELLKVSGAQLTSSEIREKLESTYKEVGDQVVRRDLRRLVKDGEIVKVRPSNQPSMTLYFVA